MVGNDATVKGVLERLGDSRSMPVGKSRSRLAPRSLHFVLYCHQSVSLKVHIKYSSYRFGLHGIDKKIHLFFVSLHDFLHSVIAEDIAVAVEHTFFH